MREGLITVPKFDNDGKSLDFLVERTMKLLAKQFGGATAIDAKGFWFGPDGTPYSEPVTQIITAYDPSDVASDGFLRGVAETIGRQAKQLAMYVRYASGTVEVISLQPEAKQAA